MTRSDLPGEIWRPVPGYEHLYEVSRLGRVYSVNRPGSSLSGRFMSLQRMRSGHLTIPAHQGTGLPAKLIGVHQLVMLAFVGPPPTGQEVRHLDGDPANNLLENLAYGTRAENIRDRAIHRSSDGTPVCHRGHPYVESNVYISPNRPRFRECRACRRERYTPRTRVVTPINHGTESGYQQHRRRGIPIPADDPCGCRRGAALAVAKRSRP